MLVDDFTTSAVGCALIAVNNFALFHGLRRNGELKKGTMYAFAFGSVLLAIGANVYVLLSSSAMLANVVWTIIFYVVGYCGANALYRKVFAARRRAQTR